MNLSDGLAILGLIVALYQIRKAERAALAAKRAADAVSRRVNVYSMLLLIPELVMAERDLEAAAISGSASDATRLLREWQGRAKELSGLLAEDQFSSINSLAVRVQESVVLATHARRRLLNGSVSVKGATEKMRAAASDVVLMAREQGSRFRAELPPPESLPTIGDDIRALGRKLSRIGRAQS